MRKGQSGIVEILADELAPVIRTRLLELGFQPGARVKCLVAPAFGAPKLYLVNNTVYSLEKQIAKWIGL
jgi:ferrous iron transport protein A